MYLLTFTSIETDTLEIDLYIRLYQNVPVS